MGDKRPLIAALALVVIGVAAAVLFRKPNQPADADAANKGESVLRRHEPAGLAAGARPVAVAKPEADVEPSRGAGLVGRINPVEGPPVANTLSVDGALSVDAVSGGSNLLTAVPPSNSGDNSVEGVQRLPNVTSPPPGFLTEPSALAREYPSTSSGNVLRSRQPAAAAAIDKNWAISATNDRAPAASDESTDVPHIRLHKIRDGDSLASLAKRFLGDSGRFLEIYEANRDVLRSPEQLPIGGQLRIPRGGQKLTEGGTARRPGDSSNHGQHPDPNRLVPVTQRPPRR
jgi:nucleoid-associated protein YgaU